FIKKTSLFGCRSEVSFPVLQGGVGYLRGSTGEGHQWVSWGETATTATSATPQFTVAAANSVMCSTANDILRSSPRTECCICGSLVSRANLQRHIRTHTGEKQYACPHCTYRTGDRSNLRRHYSHIHPNQSFLHL
ncbi:unnamed protein product, partial [Meganyctiphanes norvegica]